MFKTIRVTEETHQKITDLGGKNEDYNDIIVRLLTFYESKTKKTSSSRDG